MGVYSQTMQSSFFVGSEKGKRQYCLVDSHSWLVLVKTKLLSWRIARAQYIFELRSSGGALTASVIGPWL